MIELFALSIFAIVGIAAFIWFQSAYIPGTSFDVTISNQSLKNLSFLVVKPTLCGSWKPKNEVDIVISVLPGETKKVFNGCKASSVQWTKNGVSQGTLECLELVSNVELIYSQQGWTHQSLKNGFDPEIGAIRKCKS